MEFKRFSVCFRHAPLTILRGIVMLTCARGGESTTAEVVSVNMRELDQPAVVSDTRLLQCDLSL